MSKEISLAQEQLKTKLNIVREQLQANTDVYFAGEVHHYHNGAPEYGYWTETVDIIVSPIKPEFNPDKLNVFMNNLIVGLKNSAKDEARNNGGDGINLGRLYFDESIGTIHKTTITTITTTEPDTIKKADRVVGKSEEVWEGNMQRRTWVRVYPEPISAKTVYDYESGVANGDITQDSSYGYAQHWLTGEQIRKLKDQYSKNPIKKITAFLGK